MHIRPVVDDADLDGVYRLTHDAYVELGYIAPRPDGRLRHYADIDAAPENMVLLAVEDGVIVGTTSITLDGPAGFHVDHDFGPAAAAVRAEGRPFGAAWRIVTEPRHRSNTAVVFELIHATIDVLWRFGVETGLCTFAPRHERVYQRAIGMVTIARSDGVGAVKTPAVLMRGDVAAVARRWPPHDNPAIATLVAERKRLLDVVRSSAA